MVDRSKYSIVAMEDKILADGQCMSKPMNIPTKIKTIEDHRKISGRGWWLGGLWCQRSFRCDGLIVGGGATHEMTSLALKRDDTLPY
jgi:hypothetical protein